MGEVKDRVVTNSVAVITNSVVVITNSVVVITNSVVVITNNVVVGVVVGVDVVLLVVVLLSQTLVVMGISISTANLLQEFMHRPVGNRTIYLAERLKVSNVVA